MICNLSNVFLAERQFLKHCFGRYRSLSVVLKISFLILVTISVFCLAVFNFPFFPLSWSKAARRERCPELEDWIPFIIQHFDQLKGGSTIQPLVSITFVIFCFLTLWVLSHIWKSSIHLFQHDCINIFRVKIVLNLVAASQTCFVVHFYPWFIFCSPLFHTRLQKISYIQLNLH